MACSGSPEKKTCALIPEMHSLLQDRSLINPEGQLLKPGLYFLPALKG